MELAILAMIAVLAVPVALVWVIISHNRLSDRVRALEADLRRLDARPPNAQQAPGAQQAPDAQRPIIPPPQSAPATAPVAAPAAAAIAAPVTAPVTAQTARADSAGLDLPKPAAAPRGPTVIDHLAAWLRDNWVYAVAAVSLAAAGVFLVQYGMERGLLPPGMRVLSGIGFGAALIGGGEVIRRRYGDGPDGASAYLPSVFSGAGLVSIFAALLAGRLMYGLIGPEMTFAGLVLTALAAVVLGWLHGPLLAALGLVGATVAPFLTGGGTEAPPWLMLHFGIVAALGLGIDTLRRWGWVSVLALALAFGGGWLAMWAGAGAVAFLLLAGVLVPMAIAIPARGLVPDHAGPSVIDGLLADGKQQAAFPVMLAAGTVAATGAILGLLPLADAGAVMLAFGLAAALVVGLLVWTDRAPVLHELALIPAAAFLVRLLQDGANFGPLHRAFLDAATRPPETAAPQTLSMVMTLAALMAAALALRSRRGTAHPVTLAAGAAVMAPMAALIAEFLWSPAVVIGAYPWALHVIALAAVMVALAAMMARLEPTDPRRRTAYAALSAMVLIALALFILTTKAALSLALTVMVIAAALLDRRFRLPELSWAAVAGVAVLGWRMGVDPGLVWALDAPILPVLLSYLGPVAGMAAALWVLRGMGRITAQAFLESACAAGLALLADILLLRRLEDGQWSLLAATLALPWLVLALVQLYRLRLAGPLRLVRIILAGIAGALAGLGVVASVLLNPVISGDLVTGPPVIDSLFVTYGLPAILLIGMMKFASHLPRALRLGLAGGGGALATIYVALEIRRFWQGDRLDAPGTTQAELYTYTVALLILGAVLLWRAVATGSQPLRRAAMAVIGLASAKVFLIDAAGLSGLMRVFSFLALGLSLAGLAALNRWAAARSGPDRTPSL